MNKIGKSFPKLDTPRIAVLAAVNIADSLLKMKDDLENKRVVLQKDMVEEHRTMTDDHEKLVKECQSVNDKLLAAEARENELQRQFESLHEEYTKLQNEYNEWIQLVSLDNTDPK